MLDLICKQHGFDKDSVKELLVSVLASSECILEVQKLAADREVSSVTYEDIVKWWQNKDITDSQKLAEALDNFKIVFACNTNSIEGNVIDYHTTREIFEESSLTNYSGTAREIFEAQNQKFAFDFILKSFDSKEPITLEFVKKMHALMMYGCYDSTRWGKGERPGNFKKHDYCVGISEVGAYPDEVEEQLLDLFDDLQSCDGKGDVLTKASYLHAVFESIHPFADGNGRVGRALMNYYLLGNNYPPLVIFGEDKEVYYMALEVYNHSEELSGFVEFLKGQTIKTWEKRVCSKPKGRRLEAFL